ncbi:uncharacterized protein LOC117115272 [Anneissia japonica]|uniref:uncharacterized protein LOC117115272 n=1 Tax=Anneissia japonica TaxID=1529436 RepID=UPI0014258850|nr:uncharacterized protein LOC117115272 [Anneissia japonica]
MAMAVIQDVNSNNQGAHVPPFVKGGVRPLFAIDNIDWGSEVGPFHGADLMIAQREAVSNPVLGCKLKLNVDIKERSLKQSLETVYCNCEKPSNPRVEHEGYNSYSREKISNVYEQINVIWLFMCSWALKDNQKKIDDDNEDEIKEIMEDDDKVVDTEAKSKVHEQAIDKGGQSSEKQQTTICYTPDENTSNESELTASKHELTSDEEPNLNKVVETEANSKVHEQQINKGSQPSEEQQTTIGHTVDENTSNQLELIATKHALTSEVPNLESSTGCEFTSKTMNQKQVDCPTWSTFNSLISQKVPEWNVGIAAPLYRRSPTEWPVLLTILMQAKKINCVTAGEGCRPIISLDGDLYDRAVKLKNYKEHWCIRLGALHIAMAALKCLGKYTEGSGIDLAWEESGLYGSATVRQIIEGRHIYRGIKAHTVTLIALHHLFMQTVFNETEREEITHEVQKVMNSFESYHNAATGTKSTKTFQDHIYEMHKQLSSKDNNVFRRITEWEKHGKGIQKFLINYMNQVQVLLMFIGGTRKADWTLHLRKLEELLPYFHAHDQYNYGRWGPLYVADMLEMQKTDAETWNFLNEGNFVITKHAVPFTSIDPDHAIEQEHKKMKVKGGFVGITGNKHALEKYFIIAPSLSTAVSEFKEYSGIKCRQPSPLHHELKGNKSLKMMENAAKLVDVLAKEGNPFQQTDMFNLVTFVVTSNEVGQTIANRDKLGKDAFDKFVSTRMVEKTVHFWDPQKKNNFSYFKDVGAVAKTKIKGQLVSIKQERKLLSRLLVVAKSRPEFALKDVIGTYEFNCTPPSNFHPDGGMIMLSGKSKVLQSIMNLALPDNVTKPAQNDNTTKISILIIDGMCIVIMVKKVSDKFNASDFASECINMIVGMSKPYDEICDQYLPGSLKEITRDKRTKKTTTIQYHVNDNTEIKNIKTFLSHIETKAELTKYLSEKLLNHFKDTTKRVLVMYHTTIKANCDLSEITTMPEMKSRHHTLEEGDQMVLLNTLIV